MAHKPQSRKPRVRKTAPTLRQRAEAAANEQAKSSPARRFFLLVRTPFARLNPKQRRLFKPVYRLLNLVGRGLRWLIPSYFFNSWQELRQVTWPNRKETWRLTIAVFIFAIVFGALVAAVDKGLDVIFKKFVLE